MKSAKEDTKDGLLVASEITTRLVIDAMYAHSIMPSLVRVADITKTPNISAVEFFGAPLYQASDIENNDNAPNINTHSIFVRPQAQGILISVTDVLLSSAGVGGLEPYAYEIGKALANKIDSDLLAEVSDFVTLSGSTNTVMTEATFLDALYKLEAANAKGPFVCVLHPKQISDLRLSISSNSGAIWNGPSAAMGGLGAFASLYGVDMFKSTNCWKINCGVDLQGVMMPIGNQSGIGYVLSSNGKTTLERKDRSTDVVVQVIYGKECINTTASGGVAIFSKA